MPTRRSFATRFSTGVFAASVAVVGIALTFATQMVSADPGNGNGNPNPHKNTATPTNTATSTDTPTTTATPTDTATATPTYLYTPTITPTPYTTPTDVFTLTPTATAVPPPSLHAIMGLGICAGNGYESISVTGSGIVINGGMHGNGVVEVNGNSQNPIQIDGPASAFTVFDSSGATFTNPSAPISFAPYIELPALWDIDDFKPVGRIAEAVSTLDQYYSYTGNVTDWSQFGSGHPRPGIYFVSGNITLNGSDFSGTNLSGVTLVATGNIDLSYGSTPISHTAYQLPFEIMPDAGVTAVPLLFTPYVAPDFAPTCDSLTNNNISILGRVNIGGVIYAPNGDISLSLAAGSIHTGAIIGYRVDLSGSGFTLNFVP